MRQPILSIVVPTRDRQGYAVACVRSILASHRDDLELIVQDNSASDQLRAQLGDLAADPRLRYAHDAQPVSAMENCDRGVARARGTFVTLIGDDDGINLEAIEAAVWAEARGADALVPRRLAIYYWPDFRQRYYGDRLAGTLSLGAFTGRVRTESAEEGLQALLRSGAQTLVESVRLPKLYYGLVRRTCLEALRARAGTVFPGVSPDMASAVGLVPFARSVVSVDYPLFVPGSSANSNAGESAMKRHVGRLEDQRHLPSESIREWPPEVPRVYTVQTVWAQSAITALRASGQAALVSAMDVVRMHAQCAVFNPQVSARIVANLLRTSGPGPAAAARNLARFLVWVASAYADRARSLVGRIDGRENGSGRSVGSIPDIAAAVQTLRAWLGEAGWTWARVASAAGPLDEPSR